MINAVKRFSDFLTKGLWEVDTSSLTRVRSFIVKTLRLINVTVREFTEGKLTLQAMSLVYTTLLAIVPLLAISFSVLKAFGVHTEVVGPFLMRFLEPLGSKGEEITLRIIGFVENVKVGVLGSLGLVLLLYTVISVIQKVERSFNSIWRIRKSRSISRRFSDYVSVLLVGPVLMFSAIGLTATLMSHTIVQKIISVEPFGTVFYFAVEKSPYIIVFAVFTFVYMFLPNTKVRFRSAVVGGILAAILWQTAGWGFASFIVTSAKYKAIYSGFAILIMFLIWLNLSWLILLFGAQIAFYHQYPHFLTARKEAFRLSNRLRERLALVLMYLIGYNHYHSKSPWTLNALVDHLKLPVDAVHTVLDLLEQNSLLVETNDDPPAYIPAHAVETLPLRDLLAAVRIAERDALSIEHRMVTISGVNAIMNDIDAALGQSLGDRTLGDLVKDEE